MPRSAGRRPANAPQPAVQSPAAKPAEDPEPAALTMPFAATAVRASNARADANFGKRNWLLQNPVQHSRAWVQQYSTGHRSLWLAAIPPVTMTEAPPLHPPDTLADMMNLQLHAAADILTAIKQWLDQAAPNHTCILLAWDQMTNRLTLLGQDTGLWHFRNGMLTDVRRPNAPAEVQAISLAPGDRCYAFTGSLIRQTGGLWRQALGLPQLRNQLVQMQQEPFRTQRTRLEQWLRRWKRNGEPEAELFLQAWEVD